MRAPRPFGWARKYVHILGGPRCAHRGPSDGRKCHPPALSPGAEGGVLCTANKHHQTTPSAPASRALRWDRIETLSGAMLEKKFPVWVVRGE